MKLKFLQPTYASFGGKKQYIDDNSTVALKRTNLGFLTKLNLSSIRAMNSSEAQERLLPSPTLVILDFFYTS